MCDHKDIQIAETDNYKFFRCARCWKARKEGRDEGNQAGGGFYSDTGVDDGVDLRRFRLVRKFSGRLS